MRTTTNRSLPQLRLSQPRDRSKTCCQNVPQPGGRFPSTDLIVNPERGLQAPLSPSSGSSNFGDVQDRDVAAASALPGSGVGQHYAEDSSTSPTHAAMVNQCAQQDGINPYTNQPIYSQHDTHIHAEQAAAGLTTAGLSGGGHWCCRRHSVSTSRQQDKAAKFEHVAALEPAKLSASDTDVPNLEAQPAREAALVAAPDTVHDIPSDENIMSSGRSTGDLGRGDLPAAGAEITIDADQTATNKLGKRLESY